MTKPKRVDPVEALLGRLDIPADVVAKLDRDDDDDSARAHQPAPTAPSPPQPPTNTKGIQRAVLTPAELAPYIPRRTDKPLRGLAHRVHQDVSSWLLTAPRAAVLPFVTIERDLGVSGDRMRSLRHNHQALNRALSKLGLTEVGITSGRMIGYRRH
jgi:hypothetical protein